MSDIYVDDIGEGFPFVLVHGYLGSSEMWTFQKEFFSKDYRVITPALPGFGESHNVKSLDSINKMAKEIINVLDQKKIDKFNLIGHSMGGMIVQEITKLIGDRVNKLICFATGSIGDIPGRFGLFPHKTVMQNVGYGLEMQGKTEEERHKLPIGKN